MLQSFQKKIRDRFYSLPIQLVFLHFRRNQVLLLFWFAIIGTVLMKFATNFGAHSLFLAPYYLGKVSDWSFVFLGMALGVFIMSWNITTFIIHSSRMPFLGFTRHSFLIYCLNNFLIPFVFLIIFIPTSTLYLIREEQVSWGSALYWQFLFVFSMLLVFLISFLYFFNLGKDIFKVSLEKLLNPSAIRNVIPYDRLDKDFHRLTISSYIGMDFKIKETMSPRAYNVKLLREILNRHHRNAIFAIIAAFIVLGTIGFFIEYPIFQVPAATGFLLLFAILIAGLGMIKYFLRSWEFLGWILFGALVAGLIHFKVLDFRSHVKGLNYYSTSSPEYSYESLKEVFTEERYMADYAMEKERLQQWKTKLGEEKQPVVLVAVSGGGSRSAFWSFKALQLADSLTEGKLYENTILLTGASGGMIGAAYWRNLHAQLLQEKEKELSFYDDKYLDHISADLLNPVVLALASIDLISPLNKINYQGWRSIKDRALIFENSLAENTEGVLSGNLSRFEAEELRGEAPILLPYGTLIKDGRKVIFSSTKRSFLARGKESLKQRQPVIDAIDFKTFFEKVNAEEMGLNSALRMSASFPLIMPVTNLPSQPRIQVSDAGLRDNYGEEVIWRYINAMFEELDDMSSELIILHIRDTKPEQPKGELKEDNLTSILTAPFWAIQQNWNVFQSYRQTYNHDMVKTLEKDLNIKILTLSYSPIEGHQKVPLNFFLTNKQKQEMLWSVYHQENKEVYQQLQELLLSYKE